MERELERKRFGVECDEWDGGSAGWTWVDPYVKKACLVLLNCLSLARL